VSAGWQALTACVRTGAPFFQQNGRTTEKTGGFFTQITLNFQKIQPMKKNTDG
jgi:hypothetical protein